MTANCPTDNTRIFECFKIGRHVSMSGSVTEWGEADLERICSNYRYQLDPAPLVLGHPIDNAPAYGEVKELFHKRGVLYAVAACGQTLIDMVRAGRYKNVSASFMAAGTLPGWALRHIGFLGAHPPAVKGLVPLQFAELYQEMPASGVLCFAAPDVRIGDPAAFAFGFNSPPGWEADPVSLHKFQCARQVHTDCPNLSFAEAASLAEQHFQKF